MPPKAKPKTTPETKATTQPDHSILIKNLAALDGLGMVSAKKLVEAGVRSMRDLKLKKYQKLLPYETLLAVEYPIDKELPYDYVHSLISSLPNYLVGVGSYRRKKAFLHDIDLLTTQSFDKIIKDLEALEKTSVDLDRSFRLIGHYSSGPSKHSMIVKFNRRYVRVDIFKTTAAEKPYALLHYTGSKDFNIRIRAVAKRKGYKLNQKELVRVATGEKIKLKTEAEILKFLGVTYKAPEYRSE